MLQCNNSIIARNQLVSRNSEDKLEKSIATHNEPSGGALLFNRNPLKKKQ
jgi:hypothetical protein